MTSISQRIPNLLLGVSQQPDIRKVPGQVRDLNNGFPDYALGMLKRPGGELRKNLYDANTGGRWFTILRDSAEKYICQYADSKFRIWLLSDGKPRRVDMQTANGQNSNCNQTDFETKLNTYNTKVANTATKLADLIAKQKDYAVKLAGQNSTTEQIFELVNDYDETKGTIGENLKSGAIENKDGIWRYKDNDTILAGNTSTVPNGYTLGDERTEEHPLLASEGFKIYALVKTIAAANTSNDLTTAQTALTAAENAYDKTINSVNPDGAVQEEAAAKTALDSEISDCAVTIPSGGYLKDATADDLEFLTISDTTLVLNKKKTVAMENTTSPADTAGKRAFVSVNLVSYNTSYRVTIKMTSGSNNGTTRVTTHSTPTAVDTSNPVQNDSNSIATALRDAIVADTNLNFTSANARVVGPGIFLESAETFEINVSGGSQDNAITVFQDKVASQAQLPNQCTDGYVAKIINATDLTQDDMYVKFETTASATDGPGTWTETVAPALKTTIDPDTMPHKLERLSDGSFKFSSITYNNRLVGDDNSAPVPAFVDNKITNMVFYRNRLCFLSGDTINMSRSGDFFNFFATSAVQAVDDDPIEIGVSTTKAAGLRYGQTVQSGLVLFGDRQQYLLSTDGDVLSPLTAKVNSISSYECDANLGALDLGSTITFAAKTPLYTRVYQFANITTEEAPTLNELTNVVPEFIPAAVDQITASSTQSMIAAGQTGNKKVFFYRFVDVGTDRQVSTWFTWDLTGTLLHHFFDQSSYFAVVKHGSEVFLNVFDLSQADETGNLTLSTGEKTDVCLDHFFTECKITYNSTNDESTITLPFTHLDTDTHKLAIVNTGDGTVTYPTIADGATTFTVDEDWRGKSLVLGYVYEFNIELPKFFYTQSGDNSIQSDFTADLVIHRFKMSAGLGGPLKYKVNITGIPEYEKVITIAAPYSYTLGSVNMLASSDHEVPLYQRNENLKINIIADTPFPLSLLAMQWEGRLGNKFYRRA
jgi:hypothetical protein